MTTIEVYYDSVEAFTYTPSVAHCILVDTGLRPAFVTCVPPATATLNFKGTTVTYFMTIDTGIRYSLILVSLHNGPTELVAVTNSTGSFIPSYFTRSNLENTEYILKIGPAFQGGPIYIYRIDYYMEAIRHGLSMTITESTTSFHTAEISTATSLSSSSETSSLAVTQHRIK